MSTTTQDTASQSPTEDAPAPPRVASGSIAAPAIRGSIWTIGGYAAGQLLRLGSNLILTRLLFPAVFGQMALVFIFVQGLQMFSDVGTGPAIVQSPRGDEPGFLRTAWTIQSARGLVLWLCSWLVSWPVASFYDQPLLAWLIPAAAFNAVLGGLESTSMHTLQRHLRLGRLTAVELAGQTLGIVATVVLAAADRWLYGPNHPGAAWAMVGGSLAGGITRLVLSHTVLPGIRHRFHFERDAARILFSFGRWIFVSTMLAFLAGQSDRLVFGKMIPIDLFGVYGIAAMLAMLPTQAVQKLGGAVVFPAYSRLAARGDLARHFWRVRLPLLLGGAAIVTGLIACGPFLVRIMYDSRYTEAGWLLQFLAASAWFQILECTVGAALLAQRQVAWVAAGSASKLVGMVALIPLGFHLAGFPGALAGLVLSDAVKYLTASAGLARRGLSGVALDGLLTAAVIAISWVGLQAGNALGSGPGRTVALVGFLASGVVAGGIWSAIGLWYLRREKAAGTLPWARPASQ
jgi:O-antigen/teichoic acid export membrane protein